MAFLSYAPVRLNSAWMGLQKTKPGSSRNALSGCAASVEDGPVAHFTSTLLRHEQGHAAGAPAIRTHHRDQSPAVAQLGEQRFGPFGNCRIHEDGIDPLANAEIGIKNGLSINGDVGHAGLVEVLCGVFSAKRPDRVRRC